MSKNLTAKDLKIAKICKAIEDILDTPQKMDVMMQASVEDDALPGQPCDTTNAHPGEELDRTAPVGEIADLSEILTASDDAVNNETDEIDEIDNDDDAYQAYIDESLNDELEDISDEPAEPVIADEAIENDGDFDEDDGFDIDSDDDNLEAEIADLDAALDDAGDDVAPVEENNAPVEAPVAEAAVDEVPPTPIEEVVATAEEENPVEDLEETEISSTQIQALVARLDRVAHQYEQAGNLKTALRIDKISSRLENEFLK